MKIGWQVPVLTLAAISLMTWVDAVHAQATRTWVSGVGDDANPCSRTAPCKTFAGAISKTAAGGEINCMDAGAYGAVTITKSITIACEDFPAGVLHSSTNGVIVNAGATDVIVLRGLDIEGAPPASPGLNGIRFLNGAALFVEDCSIRNSRAAAPNGNGVFFAPGAGTPELYVRNSIITSNGIGTGGAGIQIAPTGSGGARVVIENTVLSNNTRGVRAESSGTSGSIDVTIKNSTATDAQFHGFVAIGGGGGVRMMLDGILASHNQGEGIRVQESNAGIRIGRSTVNYNGTGIATANGGNILSYGTNQIDGNINNGILPPTSPQK